MQKDLCPKCGSEGIFGLRSHPKFATCFEGITHGEPDMHMAYFHKREHNEAFANLENVFVIYKQFWNEGTNRWEEYP